jgi:hypothetical protein
VILSVQGHGGAWLAHNAGEFDFDIKPCAGEDFSPINRINSLGASRRGLRQHQQSGSRNEWAHGFPPISNAQG